MRINLSQFQVLNLLLLCSLQHLMSFFYISGCDLDTGDTKMSKSQLLALRSLEIKEESEN